MFCSHCFFAGLVVLRCLMSLSSCDILEVQEPNFLCNLRKAFDTTTDTELFISSSLCLFLSFSSCSFRPCSSLLGSKLCVKGKIKQNWPSGLTELQWREVYTLVRQLSCSQRCDMEGGDRETTLNASQRGKGQAESKGQTESQSAEGR